MATLHGIATKPTAVQSKRPKPTAVPAPAQQPATCPARPQDRVAVRPTAWRCNDMGAQTHGGIALPQGQHRSKRGLQREYDTSINGLRTFICPVHAVHDLVYACTTVMGLESIGAQTCI